MITTRNVALLVMALSVALSLCAAEQNVLTLAHKYMKLVQHKINFNPYTLGKNEKSQLEYLATAEKECDAIKNNILRPLLLVAHDTGLNQCYDFLLQDKDAMAKWVHKDHIKLVAYMQKEYGNGYVFAYNTRKLICPNPLIGEYVDQNDKPLLVTFYSFFFSLLNRLDGHIKDQKQLDENVRRTHNLLEAALDEALIDVEVRAIITNNVEKELGRLVDALQTMLKNADNSALTDAGSGLHQLLAQLPEHYVTK